MLTESEVVRVELLVGWGVDDLGVDLFLVVVIALSAPVDAFTTAGWQADAVHIQRVELGSLLGRASSQGHPSDIELRLCIGRSVLRLPLSILLLDSKTQKNNLLASFLLKLIISIYFCCFNKIKICHVSEECPTLLRTDTMKPSSTNSKKKTRTFRPWPPNLTSLPCYLPPPASRVQSKLDPSSRECREQTRKV